jgi:hypothetical protein
MISDKIVELRRTIEEYTCLHIPPVQCDIMGSECIPNIPTWRNVFLVQYYRSNVNIGQRSLFQRRQGTRI